MNKFATKFVALVPMKGHSVRVENKNIKDMAGRPLFHYILETLEKCKYVSKIYVDTDSEIIKEKIHEKFGNVIIISRPKNLIGDTVSMNAIIEYDISQIESSYFLQTHSTNPLLKTKTIEKSVEFFLSHQEYDSLFTVTRMQKRFYDSKGNPINHNPKILLNTQNLPHIFEENSCLYLFTKKSFEINKNRIGKKPHMFEIDKIESIDIDDEFDFELVKKIIQTKN